ncbi:MAG: sodium:solute symporter [Alistipes sp.]|nr:sodium:solute symporter [Alistipes sp.]
MTPIIALMTVAIYLVILFYVAWKASRGSNNSSFFTGGRSNSWFVTTMAMVGAAISGVTFISVPGWVAQSGFSYMQMVLGFVVGYSLVAFVLIPLFYKLNVISLYQYLDDRFGSKSYATGAWFFFISKMTGASLRAFLICAVLQTLVFEAYGVPFVANVAIMMALVWLYTRTGGVSSVISTDLLKTICLIGSVVLCIFFMIRELGLGFGEAIAQVSSHDYSQTFFFEDGTDKRFFWKQFLAGIFMSIATTGLDQDMMQRTLSCKSPRDSQKNLVISIVLQAAVIFMFLFLGVLFYIYLSGKGIVAGNESFFPMVDAAGNAIIADSDQVFSYIATKSGLPLIVGILFVLGLISSTYSAAGSAMTALTTSFTVDIMHGTKRYDEQRLTIVRKRIHIAMAVMMGIFILIFNACKNTSLIDMVYTLASYTYGPILGMFAFGIFCHRHTADKYVPFAAIIGVGLSLVLQLNSERWFGGYKFSYEILLFNAAFTAIGMWILSLKKNNK